jgi:hypothetical protein
MQGVQEGPLAANLQRCPFYDLTEMGITDESSSSDASLPRGPLTAILALPAKPENKLARPQARLPMDDDGSPRHAQVNANLHVTLPRHALEPVRLIKLNLGHQLDPRPDNRPAFMFLPAWHR